jgi:hypothetical protein
MAITNSKQDWTPGSIVSVGFLRLRVLGFEAVKDSMPDMAAIYRPKILFPKAIADKYTSAKAGWYWWSCFPGCLPDSEPMGPFETEAEAIADATES